MLTGCLIVYSKSRCRDNEDHSQLKTRRQNLDARRDACATVRKTERHVNQLLHCGAVDFTANNNHSSVSRAENSIRKTDPMILPRVDWHHSIEILMLIRCFTMYADAWCCRRNRKHLERKKNTMIVEKSIMKSAWSIATKLFTQRKTKDDDMMSTTSTHTQHVKKLENNVKSTAVVPSDAEGVAGKREPEDSRGHTESMVNDGLPHRRREERKLSQFETRIIEIRMKPKSPSPMLWSWIQINAQSFDIIGGEIAGEDDSDYGACNQDIQFGLRVMRHTRWQYVWKEIERCAQEWWSPVCVQVIKRRWSKF